MLNIKIKNPFIWPYNNPTTTKYNPTPKKPLNPPSDIICKEKTKTTKCKIIINIKYIMEKTLNFLNSWGSKMPIRNDKINDTNITIQ